MPPMLRSGTGPPLHQAHVKGGLLGGAEYHSARDTGLEMARRLARIVRPLLAGGRLAVEIDQASHAGSGRGPGRVDTHRIVAEPAWNIGKAEGEIGKEGG